MTTYRTLVPLNLRSSPRIAQNVSRTLPKGTRVISLQQRHIANNYEWLLVLLEDYTVGWVALRSEFLQAESAAAVRNTFGLHYYPYGADPSALLDAAGQGLLQMVTVVNDVDVAERALAKGVPYVVLRVGVSENEPVPPISGTQADYQIGWDWFFSERLWQPVQHANPRLILQLHNESNFNENLPAFDNFFTLGCIAAADSVGRRLAVFNDAVGNPHMWYEDGRYHSTTWLKRTDALRACLYTASGSRRAVGQQHFVSYHAYSRPGAHRASELTAREWYAGRFEGLYSVVPQFQPPLLLTEYGSYDASVPAMGGYAAVAQDVKDSMLWLQNVPNVVAFAYWTIGQWQDSAIDNGLPLILSTVRSVLQV
mgnify:CR=1 FL=1